MTFVERLQNELSDLHLLKHPFYQDWTAGTLSMGRLQNYAKQYYWHVDAFPRYISSVHSNCEDINKRSILLENLNDEEGSHGKPHPELWLDFTIGLGVDRQKVMEGPKGEAIQNVIDTFFKLSRSSYCEGLAALYAYEYQVPEVAKTKIEGLEQNYSITDPSTLSFFQVHQEADVIHRLECEKLLDQLDDSEKEQAIQAAREAGQALWNFLSVMHECELENVA